MKLAIGTAQFGLDYGVSNHRGATGLREVRRIVGLARRHGVDCYDTASGYGDSEQKLGAALACRGAAKVVTKTPAAAGSAVDAGDIEGFQQALQRSLQRLKCERLYALLLHSAADLHKAGSDRIGAWFDSVKARGLVQKTGVSVYSPRQLERALAQMAIDIVQLPLNIFDQRFLAGDAIARLQARGIEVHVRSCFLQGLLLLPVAQIPPALARLKSRQAALREFAAGAGLDMLSLCLGFCHAVGGVDKVVCGVNDSAQLAQLLQADIDRAGCLNFDRFAVDDEMIVNPARWEL